MEVFNVSSPFGDLRVESPVLWGWCTSLYDLTRTTVSVCVPRAVPTEERVTDDVMKVVTYDPASAVAALLRAQQTSGVHLEDAVESAYGSTLRVARAHANARAQLSRRELALLDNYEAYRVGVTRRLHLSCWQEFVCFLGDVVDVTPEVAWDFISKEYVSAAQLLIGYWWLAIMCYAVIMKFHLQHKVLCCIAVSEVLLIAVAYATRLYARLSA